MTRDPAILRRFETAALDVLRDGDATASDIADRRYEGERLAEVRFALADLARAGRVRRTHSARREWVWTRTQPAV